MSTYDNRMDIDGGKTNGVGMFTLGTLTLSKDFRIIDVTHLEALREAIAAAQAVTDTFSFWLDHPALTRLSDALKAVKDEDDDEEERS